MKQIVKTSLLAVTVAASLSTGAVAAEESTKIGLGVNVDAAGNNTIYVPIFVDETIRIQPALGFSNIDIDGTSTSYYNLGCEGHVLQDVAKDTQLYFGGGAYYNNTDAGTKYDSFSLKGVVGADYYVSPKFSIGAEAGLFLNFGDVSGLNTTTSAVARFYF